MKIFRPNRFIWAITVFFLATLVVLAALVVLRSEGSDLLGALLLLLISLYCVLFVGYLGSSKIELTSTYVAQLGWRPWRLDWSNFDKIVISEDAEGCSIALIDRQGIAYVPLALLVIARKDKAAFIASVREHEPRAPNHLPDPTRFARGSS